MKPFAAIASLVVLGSILGATPTSAATASAPATAGAAIASQLDALIDRFNVKIEAGKTTAADLAPELLQLDALLAANQPDRTDAVADILALKIKIYEEVVGDPATALALVRQFQTDFPDTKRAREAGPKIKSLEEAVAAAKIANSLAVGVAFPPFAETDLDGHPLTLAGLKGRVVLIDFWATWCEPCVAELPNLTATYRKFHDRGFAIVGVSLDHAESKGSLTAFIQSKGMAWPEFFDGKELGNKLAVKYGVHALPCNYLLDAEGKIIGKNLRAEKLDQAVAAALAKEGKV